MSRRSRDANNPADGGLTRLQKFLSDAGVASRRRAEELILEGHVLVNDQLVDSLPAFVDPQRDVVLFDGAPVRMQPLEYWILNKPKGVACAIQDTAGRRRALDFLPDDCPRLQVVGRMDIESTGLLLLTNDHELAQRVANPRTGVPVVYRVEVRGQAGPDLAQRLKRGVHLAEGRVAALEAVVLHRSRDASALDVLVREERHRQLRRMLVRLGHPAVAMRRTEIGPLNIKGLPVGGCRRLNAWELGALKRALAASRETPDARHPKRPRRHGPPDSPKPPDRRSVASPPTPTRGRRVIR
jgi:pseudouridine synthase